MEAKKCTRCGETKPIEEYRMQRATKDGKSYWCKECFYFYNKGRKLTPGVRAERAARRRQWVEKYHEQRHAYNIIRSAFENGALVRGPCEVCGGPRTDAHHDDYSKPLEVRFLCRKHHGEAHSKTSKAI